MLIRAGYEIAYECAQPTPMLLALSVHPSRLPDVQGPHEIRFDPPVEARNYLDGFGNTVTRLVAPEGRLTISKDVLVRDSGQPDPVVADAEQAFRHVLAHDGSSIACDADSHRDPANQATLRRAVESLRAAGATVQGVQVDAAGRFVGSPFEMVMKLGSNSADPACFSTGKYRWWLSISVMITSEGNSRNSSSNLPTTAEGYSTKFVTSSSKFSLITATPLMLFAAA